MQGVPLSVRNYLGSLETRCTQALPAPQVLRDVRQEVGTEMTKISIAFRKFRKLASHDGSQSTVEDHVCARDDACKRER